ncbi:MAG: hypothetical protein PHV12_08685 [Bacteroidales bacterium]|nr:hypothetical protein [Bacteroidales bacterium]
MKISNDIVKMYGTAQEQKGEIKIKGDEHQLAPEATTQLKNVSTALPPEVKQALEEIFGRDIPLDKEAIQALKTYIDRFPGSLDEKIQVIEALLGKDLDININNMKLVHEAMYGREISKIIEEIESGAKDMASLVQEIKNLLAKGIHLGKISDFLESEIEATDMSTEVKAILTKAANESRQAASYNMDDLGQKIILKALKDVSEKISKKSPDNIIEASPAMQGEAEEEYIRATLGAAALGGKEYLVVEISTRLKEASQSFKELKKDMTNNLDMAVRYIKESGGANIQNARLSLQKTIDTLDKVILKGDIALFADMKLEKELVKADSDLQKAKMLLDRGEYDKAWKLVDKVRSTIETINWKPSNNRIIHYASLKEGLTESANSEDKLKAALKGLTENFTKEDYSPRKIYDAIRLLGGDHEGETARFLAGEKLKEEDLHNNVKSLLLKLSEKDSPMAELSQKISGSQLLNKADNGPMQTMFFALPLLIDGNMSDIKVYVNSKKDEKKLDWQNCSIFFLINTKKLGETGILLQASGGNLSITVKNDREDMKERVSPLLQGFKENLKELGYEVGNIGFARLSAKEESKAVAKPVNPIMKGFDIKI